MKLNRSFKYGGVSKFERVDKFGSEPKLKLSFKDIENPDKFDQVSDFNKDLNKLKEKYHKSKKYKGTRKDKYFKSSFERNRRLFMAKYEMSGLEVDKLLK